MGHSSIDYLLKHGKETGIITSISYGKFTKTDRYVDMQMGMVKSLTNFT